MQWADFGQETKPKTETFGSHLASNSSILDGIRALIFPHLIENYGLMERVQYLAVFIVVFCIFNLLSMVRASSDSNSCPVCHRIISAVRSYSKDGNISQSNALDSYCKLKTLEPDDQKFCYNIDNIQGEIKRLLELNADASRICKKLLSINPHFCQVKIFKDSDGNAQVFANERHKRGIIYI